MNQHLEQVVAQRTEQLQKANSMLIETNKELDVLIYRASHDFKGPVATLTGLSYIGKMECGEFAPAVEILGKIEEVAMKMDKMLEKLHQVSYIIGKELALEPMNLAEVVENATYSLDKVLEQHPIQIETTISPTFKFEADFEILQMMVENIIENSALYRRADALPAPALHIKAESDADFATIIFEDNGLGIASDFLHKAFEMFSRGTELAKGNGLGLYVVKQGLERFFGKESIQSVEDMYTRITLTFDKKAMNFDYRASLLESLGWEDDEDII
jgi:light-regulated signal transduction histidine kinase (bacteriophytochrome)